MATEKRDRLIRALRSGSVSIVVGTGVSVGAMGGPSVKPTVTWAGLIRDGLKAAAEHTRKSDRWVARELEKLEEAFDDGDLEDVLAVASGVERRLGYPTAGAWSAWLRKSFEAWQLADARVPKALVALGAGRLFTTNYDDVLRLASDSSLEAVPYTIRHKVARIVRGEAEGIVHLHGHWDSPASVVLGRSSYADVVTNTHAQAMQEALASTQTLLFVGFGGGLEDPNFGPLLEWMKTFREDEHEHFRVARADEVDAVRKAHHPDQRITVLSYGDTHADLPVYLEALVRDAGRDAKPARAPAGWVVVDFGDQRDLSTALRGESLGPRDIEACPKLPEVAEVSRSLEERNFAALVSDSGAGKSITAFHVAAEAAAGGATVLRLVDAATAVASMVAAESRTQAGLLLVDDAHLLPQQSLTALSEFASEATRVLFIATDSLPGRWTPIRIDKERAVQTLAERLSDRSAELEKLVNAIDEGVGERYLDTPVERVLEDAAKAEQPWQFMFVLGRGHVRCRAAIEALRRADDAHWALVALAIGQIGGQDRPVDRDRLAGLLRPLGRDQAWLRDSLERVREQGLLFEVRGSLSTPHPRVAISVLSLTKDDLWRKGLDQLVRAVLVDRDFPRRGRAWLLRELSLGGWPGGPLLDEATWAAIAEELESTTDEEDAIASAGWMLDACISAGPGLDLVRRTPEWLLAWYRSAGPRSSFPLADIANQLHNNSPSDATRFVNALDPKAVAGNVNDAAGADLYGVSHLADRLLVSADVVWKTAFFESLDLPRIAARWQEWPPELLFATTDLASHLVWTELPEREATLRSLLPTVRASFAHDALGTWIQIRDLVQWSLGFNALEEEGPEGFALTLGRELAEQIDPATLASELSTSRRRDWEPLGHLVAWVRQAAPEVSAEVAKHVKVEPLLERMAPHWEKMPRELELLLGALMLDGEEPCATIVLRQRDALRVFPAWLAALFPDVTHHCVHNHGAMICWRLSGGLPAWKQARMLLRRLEAHTSGFGAQCLETVAADFAEGLLLSQRGSGKGGAEFLDAAVGLAPKAVAAACLLIDEPKARQHWPARLEDATDVATAVLTVVSRERGPAQTLAKDLLLARDG